MKRLMAILAACGIALGLTVGAAGTASAAGEVLACRIAPAPITAQFTTPSCVTRLAARTYTTAFVVQNETAPFTAAWSVPAHVTIVGGCTSATIGCTLQWSSAQDHDVTVSVTLTEAGVPETLSATAVTSAVCGNVFC
ncbi:MAG TPA: hypothetical protein VEO01_25755 [Pseudonocardiaceae bacterium]|nr:hypothetical protein [Pseudonocardiaceae bacterium]